jgi:hypothetical protein
MEWYRMAVIFQIAQDHTVMRWPKTEIESICYTKATTIADRDSFTCQFMPNDLQAVETGCRIAKAQVHVVDARASQFHPSTCEASSLITFVGKAEASRDYITVKGLSPVLVC